MIHVRQNDPTNPAMQCDAMTCSWLHCSGEGEGGGGWGGGDAEVSMTRAELRRMCRGLWGFRAGGEVWVGG